QILNHLPPKCVARASTLSKSWRFACIISFPDRTFSECIARPARGFLEPHGGVSAIPSLVLGRRRGDNRALFISAMVTDAHTAYAIAQLISQAQSRNPEVIQRRSTSSIQDCSFRVNGSLLDPILACKSLDELSIREFRVKFSKSQT
ncbi:hypothetical protein TorRG33x02_320070, partial [Trema orientale]